MKIRGFISRLMVCLQVCCGVLQCMAVRGSVQQYVAVCCGVSQGVYLAADGLSPGVLQYVEGWCSAW